MNINAEIIFEHRRCQVCGGWWAIEKFCNYGDLQCPWCAGQAIEKAGQRLLEIERSMRALRANFTRLKRKQ